MRGTLTEMIGIRMSPELLKRLRDAAARDDRKVSDLARLLIKRGLGKRDKDGEPCSA